MSDDLDSQPARPQDEQDRGLRGRLAATLLRTTPGWTGAAVLCSLSALALWVWRSIEQVIPGAALASWRAMVPDLLVAVGVGLVAATVVALVARLLHRWVPWLPLLAVVASVVLLATMGPGASLVAWLVVVAVVVVASCVIGGTAWALVAARRRGTPAPSPSRRVVAGIALLAVVVGAVWMVAPGADAPPLTSPRSGAGPEDPTQPGPYEVVETTYGSGVDRIEPRYGAEVDVQTDPVDASSIIGGWDAGTTRSSVWGFDASALPLNATVWSPVEDGRYPLVLVLHGNTSHDASELGFGYLGELLASRGYVVASVDENFLNTGVLDKSGGLTGVSPARAWLLLQHLDLWSSWDADSSSPFSGRVDLGQVALVGHSRGGEAVAVAAEMARRGSVAELPGLDLSTDATIRAVVAIAPSDGQDEVDGEPTRLEEVSYLTLAGSHDADVLTFAGSRQYARTQVGDGLTKAAVAIYRADHAQFNTRWGSTDVGLGLAKHVLDTAALLAPDEQRQAASAFISGFLDLTLKADETMAVLFAGPLPDVAWLPSTAYATTYATGDQRLVESFDAAAGADAAAGVDGADGADAGQTRLGVAETAGAGAEIRELPSRIGATGNAALHLTWTEPGATARYTVRPEPGLVEAGASHLVFSVADATSPDTDRADVAMSIEVTDGAGATATVPVGALPSGLPGRVVKQLALAPTPSSEPLLQTYQVDLAALDGIDLATIATITWVFEPTAGDGVYLDDVGFAP